MTSRSTDPLARSEAQVALAATDSCVAGPLQQENPASQDNPRFVVQLRHSEQYLRTIADALPMLVAYVDVNHRYRFINQAYERWFGRPRHEVLGRHVSDVLGHEAYLQLREHIDAALAGTSLNFQRRVAYRDGPERDIDATYAPHVAESGQIEGYVSLVADISDRRRLESAQAAALDRTARLMQITAALAEAVTPSQVFEAVVNQVATSLNASSGGLFALDADCAHVQLLHSVGYSPDSCRALRSVPVSSAASLPALDAIRTGIPLWFASQQQLLESYPHLTALVTPGRSYQVACLPIFVQRRPLGSVAFTFEGLPPIDVEQQNFLLLVARYSGQALERLRLLESERKSRERAEATALRADILSRASRALAEAGDNFSGVLQVLAEQVTTEYADLCYISLFQEGELGIAALHHRRPETAIHLRALFEASPLHLTGSPLAQIIATGKSQLISQPELHAALLDIPPEYRTWLEKLMPGSAIVAPLRTRSGVIGAVCAVREVSSGEFQAEDVRFFEELAERIAIAIETSRLYEAHQQARARTELLYGLARAVIGATDLEQVFDAALDTLEQALGTQRAAILTFDRTGQMKFRAWRRLSDSYRAAVEGHSPWAKNQPDPAPIFIEDTKHAPSMAAFSSLFAREHIGALGFIPLLSAGQLIGKFMVYYDGPRQLATHELQMAKAIANHVAAAVSRFGAVGELLEAVRFSDVFIGILGHDLRNPLGAIMTSAQLALRRADGDRHLRPLSRILTSGTRMSRMIDQLLDFTRVRVGSGIPVERKPVELTLLLQQVIDELDDAYPQWSLRVESVGPTRGNWDADRLAQVFSNLVANALQHGEVEGGVLVLVDGTDAQWMRVQVINKGLVPQELLPSLFEPMTGGVHRRHKSQGLGLGLYISQQIIRSHRGRIQVTSSDLEGTIFTVHLPKAAEQSFGVER